MGFLANKSYPCGKVVQGDYKDAYVYIWDENTLSLFREKEFVFGKFVSEETHRKSLNQALIANISSHTVENYEVLSQNQSSEDAGDVLNATLLFGAVGTIAASRQITKTNYLISVEFQSGKKSIIRLNEAGYENFLTAIKFKIKPQENKINEKTSQAQPSFSVADELKKFKELLDCGAISQEEFDAVKKQLLGQGVGVTLQETKQEVDNPNHNLEKKDFNAATTTDLEDIIEQVFAGTYRGFFFTVTGVVPTSRGTVATGEVECGQISVGNRVAIHTQSGNVLSSAVTGINKGRQLIDTANQGDGVGLLLSGILERDIQEGDTIIKE